MNKALQAEAKDRRGRLPAKWLQQPLDRALAHLEQPGHLTQAQAPAVHVGQPATVNRGLAVLKHMLTVALEREYIETHPLLRYRMLPEPQHDLRVLTYDEYRRLIECVSQEDPVIGAYVTLARETGLRKREGLRLKWSPFTGFRRAEKSSR